MNMNMLLLSTKLCSVQRNVIQIALRNASSSQNAVKLKASNEQLNVIYTQLSKTLPDFFSTTHNYGLYHQNIIFEDNIRGVKTRGLTSYVMRLAWLKIAAHINYSHIKMHILKITQHPEDCTVRVRWRAVGIPGYKAMVFFWRYRLRPSSYVNKPDMDNSVWHDGFSIFYVESDGRIHKHVIEKIMPDEEVSDKKSSNNMAVKLAILLGLMARSGDNDVLDDLSSLVSRLTNLIELIISKL